MHLLNLDQILPLLELHKYLLLFPIVIVEGPIITIIAGYMSSLGFLNFFVAYLVMVVGDLAGDMMYYSFGRWGRLAVIEKYGHHVGITTKRIEDSEKIFRVQGTKLLLTGKTTVGLGGAIIIAAGALKINFKKFVTYSLIGTLPKSLVLMIVGFYLGHAYIQIQKYFDYTEFISIIILALGISAYYIYKKNKII